jgi:membrane protein DedA with SNARE-associated domain
MFRGGSDGGARIRRSLAGFAAARARDIVRRIRDTVDGIGACVAEEAVTLDFFALLRSAPPLPFYLLVCAAASAQNLVPVPVADLLVLFGAFLVARAPGGWAGVLACAWIGNVGTAAGFYAAASLYRSRRSRPRILRWLLARAGAQGEVPTRWNFWAVFLGSYLPIRPVLPVIAGLAGVRIGRLFRPLGLAAALWYVGVVSIGTLGGRDLAAVTRVFAEYERIATIALLTALVVAVAWWLWRRRRRRR